MILFMQSLPYLASFVLLAVGVAVFCQLHHSHRDTEEYECKALYSLAVVGLLAGFIYAVFSYLGFLYEQLGADSNSWPLLWDVTSAIVIGLGFIAVVGIAIYGVLALANAKLAAE